MAVILGPHLRDGLDLSEEEYTLGRQRGCDIVVHSANASRKHARIIRRHSGYSLQDLGSRNGTALNGAKITTTTELTDGDKISIADVHYVFQADERTDGNNIVASRPHKKKRSTTDSQEALERPSRDGRMPPQRARAIEDALADQRETAEVSQLRNHISITHDADPANSDGEQDLRPPHNIGGNRVGGVTAGLRNLPLTVRAWLATSRVAEPGAEQVVTAARHVPYLVVLAAAAFLASLSGGITSAIGTRYIETEATAATDSGDGGGERRGEIGMAGSAQFIKLAKAARDRGIDTSNRDEMLKLGREVTNLEGRKLDEVVDLAVSFGSRNQMLAGPPKQKDSADTQSQQSSDRSGTARRTPPGSELANPLQGGKMPSVIQDAVAGSDASDLLNMAQRIEATNSAIEYTTDSNRTSDTRSAISNSSTSSNSDNEQVSESDPYAGLPPATRAILMTRGSGFYINPWTLLVAIVLVLLWFKALAWMQHDSLSSHVTTSSSLPMTLFGGLIGYAAILTIPSPTLSFGFFVVAAFLPIANYAYVRDQQVSRSKRLFDGSKLGASRGDIEQSANLPNVVLIGRDGERCELDNTSRSHLTTAAVLDAALSQRASDVHLEPGEAGYSVRFRVDGLMRESGNWQQESGQAVINVLKVFSGLDISDKQRPQDGRVSCEIGGTAIDLRIATQGTSHGEKLSLRLLDASSELLSLSDLRMDRHLIGSIRELVLDPEGLILCCGPTGAGKSTTLRGAITEIVGTGRNIITIEDPVEYSLDGVNQIEVNRRRDQTFATTLRSVLRQDPDVIYVGEIRDDETGAIACRAANTGHLVLSTVHANDAGAAISRLVDLGVSPKALAESLSGIIGQRLVRKLCKSCCTSRKADPETLERLRIPVGRATTIHEPDPYLVADCLDCNGTGYQSRIAIYEFLNIDSGVRSLIHNEASASEILKLARSRGMTTLREYGLRLVLNGTTSVSELERITSSRRTDE